ncbi:MAG: ABC transporter ATP-binding protein [Thermoanaerobaculia bacterium]
MIGQAARPERPAPILSVRDLRVEISIAGSWRPAVDGIDFDLAEGEALAVVGESGCGKTLLGRALLALTPEGSRLSGSLRWRGRELLGAPEKEWGRVRGRQVALVFQEPAAALDPVRTVGSQLLEAIRLHRSVRRAEAMEIARERLVEVAFRDPDRVLRAHPHRLSGGERQRAFIAIALAGDPAVLVADEPTAALDSTIAAQVLELLDRLRAERRLSLVLITHDMGIVAQRTDRALVLYAGKVAEEAATPELFRSPRHPYSRGLLRSVPRLGEGGGSGRRFDAIPGIVPDLSMRPAGICAFVPRCPERFSPCDERPPGLYPTAGGSLARCFLYEPADGSPEARGSPRPLSAGLPLSVP